MPIITEVMCTENFDIVEAYTDILQIGARNIKFPFKESGKIKQTCTIKRDCLQPSKNYCMQREYIMTGGNTKVILCERGIRTFETYKKYIGCYSCY